MDQKNQLIVPTFKPINWFLYIIFNGFNEFMSNEWLCDGDDVVFCMNTKLHVCILLE